MVPYFKRTSLRLIYIDITIGSYIQSSVVMEIWCEKKCCLLVVPNAVLVEHGVFIHVLQRSILELIFKPRHVEASALYKVLGNLRMFFHDTGASSSCLINVFMSCRC